MNRNDRDFMARKIRAQYMEEETTELDELRALDKKVKRPANIFAYVFGSIGAVVMGAGMSLVMTEIGEVIGLSDPLIPGIVIGVVGMMIALVNYPIYKGILGGRRKKYAAEILRLSETVLGE